MYVASHNLKSCFVTLEGGGGSTQVKKEKGEVILIVSTTLCMRRRDEIVMGYSQAVNSVTSSETTNPRELVPLQTKVPSSDSTTNA